MQQEEKDDLVRFNQVLLTAVIIILTVYLVAHGANAQTIQMSNPDSTGQRDIIVYFPNGTLWGSYNTTSMITLDANESYIFTLKPQGNNLIDDPGNWLVNYAFPYVKTHIIPLIVIFSLVGFLIFRRR